MPSTYTPIATQTLGSDASSVTFSSISGTYTDLILVCQATASAALDLALRVNSDTGSNYSSTALSGTGASAVSSRASGTNMLVDSYGYMDSTNPTASIYHFMNYSNSTTYKTVLGRANNGATGVDAVVGLWRNTAAITSITLVTFTGTGTFSTGSTFTLYGVKSA